jgi:hypothetical protein
MQKKAPPELRNDNITSQIMTYPLYKGEIPYSGEMIQKGINETKYPSLKDFINR